MILLQVQSSAPCSLIYQTRKLPSEMLSGPTSNLTARRGRRERWEFGQLAGLRRESEVYRAVLSPSFLALQPPPALLLLYVRSLRSPLAPVTSSCSLSALSCLPAWFPLETAVPRAYLPFSAQVQSPGPPGHLASSAVKDFTLVLAGSGIRVEVGVVEIGVGWGGWMVNGTCPNGLVTGHVWLFPFKLIKMKYKLFLSSSELS